jgi:hypothetical protein
MRGLGVQRLVASCLNDACRHVALIDVSSYPADTEVPWFRSDGPSWAHRLLCRLMVQSANISLVQCFAR